MCIREWLRRRAASLAIAGAVFLHGGAAHAQLLNLFTLPTTVSTDKGSLVGQSTNGIRQFLGVPYAAPPTGSRRWKPPAPESIYLLRDASRFAKHCAQPASPFGDASTSEDCLYLNVFAPPALDTVFKPAPVMVWLHPGGFTTGESDDFNPTALVKKGFVVVTLNYRLGALGFMSHPALSAESAVHASGNYGIMDQQAALRWVQRNIRSFGGDPKSVTLFGEDSGGASVYAHLASPASAGLFQRVIAQSGSYAVWATPQADAESRGQTFASAVGCPNQDLACLRAVPVATLLANQETNRVANPLTKEAAVLPENAKEAIQSGHFNKVPVLHGITRDEYRLYVAMRELDGFPTTDIATQEAGLSALFGYIPATAHTIAYFFWTADKFENNYSYALAEHGNDLMFACQLHSLTHYLSLYTPVYLYEFDDKTAPQDVLPAVSFAYGAYHGSEVQYILDSFDSATPLNTNQKLLADLMKTYWTQFAKTGNPNGGTAPQWPLYHDTLLNDTDQLIYMKLDQAPRAFNEYELMTEHGCGFWTFGYDF